MSFLSIVVISPPLFAVATMSTVDSLLTYLLSAPYLTVACILREIRNLNTRQPTFVKYYEGLTDDPILIPALESTGMINLRKLRKMYDTLMQATEHMNRPYSFWTRIFPDAPKEPGEGGEMKMLEDLEGVRNLVEREIEGYWNDQMSAEGMNANWE